jgi:nucleotide-binding universal stress UspA family protein
MGSHGHGRIIELVLGSTTEYLLRNAPCPIFLSR